MKLRQVMRSILTSNLVLSPAGRVMQLARRGECAPLSMQTGRRQMTARPKTSPAVTHAPNGLVAVFTNKQATIFRDGDSDRATPDFAVARDKAGHEIFIFAAGFAA